MKIVELGSGLLRPHTGLRMEMQREPTDVSSLFVTIIHVVYRL